MKGLNLAPQLTLPLETVTQSIAILAKRRVGKSYLARGFAEQLLEAQQQVVILDPKGDWWGIRSSSDGKRPGFPVVVLGGEHGDLPLEKNAAETVARLIVEERVNVLLDLSSFRKSEVALFLGGDVKQRQDGLLEIVYRLKAKEQYRTPLMLIVDEADAIAPQKPYPGEERMLGAMNDIVRRGGQRGLGSMLVSQRSAVISKDVLTQTQIMIALRTIAKLDMDSIMDWVDVHGDREQAKVLRDSLPALPVGDAWVLSAGWPTEAGIFTRIHANAITTFDSGATPKPGEKRINPKNLADVDLAALERRMAETIERKKQDDPRELRKQIAELQRELGKKAIAPAAAKPDPAAAKDALDRAAARGAAQAASQLGNQFQRMITSTRRGMLRTIEALRKTATELEGVLPPEAMEFKAIDLPPAPAAAAPTREPASRERPAPSQPANRDGGLDGPAQRILDALAELEGVGVSRAPRMQVALFAGYSHPRSKGFTNALGALRTAGHIEYPSAGTIELAASGRAIARPGDAPVTSAELHARLTGMLGGPEGKIIRELVDAYPSPIAREELSGATGYGHPRSKGFTNAIGRLRTLGYLDYPSNGQVIALPTLFLEGER